MNLKKYNLKLKYTIPEIDFGNFFEIPYDIEKKITTRPDASVHFKNGSHAKNSSKALS